MRRKTNVLRRGVLQTAVFGAAVVAAIHHLPTSLNAQSRAASTDVPDLSGIWQRRGLTEPADPVQLTARAIGFSLAFDEALSPRYDCSPAPAPFLLQDPYNFAMEQQVDRVILRYEKDDIVRTVWLDGYGHPEPGVYDFTVQGYSRGRYDGNQLVVETTKFVFDPIGLSNLGNIPSSTLKKVTERYWREGDLLKVNVITEDPLILKEPYEFTFEWELTEAELAPYECDPEFARFPAQFQPSKYQDPGWVRLPASEVGVNQ